MRQTHGQTLKVSLKFQIPAQIIMSTQNGTPDSWDQNDSGGSGDKDPVNELTKPLGALNVNAPVFVPGQNVYAPAFVPSFPNPANNTTECETMDTDGNSASGVALNDVKMESEAPDDWETKEDSPGSTTPPESSDDGGGGAGYTDTPPPLSPKPSDKKKVAHLNIVFIGHVDAGKSTIGGHIMYLTGMVEKRTLEKYEREAKEKNRESWYLSWALDTNLEERDKGKTVEVGRAYFETENRHFTILDAPGHRSFVPNMIGGASQADIGILVISARRGEFETGFERGGQTREHAMLVKTAGVRQLVVAVNKMDDSTVNWDENRYNEIKEKLTPYLKRVGFNPKTEIFYIPVSGLTGAFLKDERPDLCNWYTGPSLIQYLDNLPPVTRMAEGPIRIPVVDKYKDMGTIILGKVESGVITKGQSLYLMPNKLPVEAMQLWSDDIEVDIANPGENVKVKLKNVEEEDVMSGFVLCPQDDVCCTGKVFDAQIVILEHKSIICAGYSAVMHIHTCAEEVTIQALICLLDKRTGEKSKTRPRFIKQDQIAIVRFQVCGGIICLEAFKDFPQMGRFTLRDEGRTIAIGKVLKVIQ